MGWSIKPQSHPSLSSFSGMSQEGAGGEFRTSMGWSISSQSHPIILQKEPTPPTTILILLGHPNKTMVDTKPQEPPFSPSIIILFRLGQPNKTTMDTKTQEPPFSPTHHHPLPLGL